MADLEVNFCGIRLKNPVFAASAEPTLNAANMKKCLDAGVGGVVTKTMTDSAAMRELTTRSKWRFLDEAHTVCRGKVPRAFTLYGRSGLALEEPEEFLQETREACRYARQKKAVVIGSVASTEVEGWVNLARRMEGAGVSFLELNYGCPHPKLMPGVRTGMNVGQDFPYACEITRAVSSAVKIPVLIKVTPQVADLVEFTGSLLRAGAAGVTLTNRFIGFLPDLETGKPLIYGPAGVGGPWVKPLTLRWIHEVRCAFGDRVFIAGTNGAYDWRDVAQFIMTGAHIVEMCSAVMVYGYEWLRKQIRGFEEFLEERGYRSVSEIRGMASAAALPYAEMPKEKARLDPDLCKNCGRCLKICFYGGMQQGKDKPFIREENCVGCGGCYSVCPVPGAVEIGIS